MRARVPRCRELRVSLPAVNELSTSARWLEETYGTSPVGPAAGEPLCRLLRACHLQPVGSLSLAASVPPPSAAAAAAWSSGPRTPAPDPRPDPGARGPWLARATAASKWPSGMGRWRGRGVRGGVRALSRVFSGRGARAPLELESAVQEEGPTRAGPAAAGERRPCGLMEGGFVWVVISGPSWEHLMIRKSNKQGNPVFHTQLWPRPERLCVSSCPPHEAAVSFWGIGGNPPSPHLPQLASSMLLIQFTILGADTTDKAWLWDP